MANWQEAAKERKGDTIYNCTWNANGGMEEWNGLMVFHESWPGQAQIVTLDFDELVTIEEVDANLPENLNNDLWS